MSFAMGRGYARHSRSQRSIGRRVIREHVAGRGFRSVLDLGCGPGTLTGELLRALPGAKAVGLDLDAAALALARRGVPAARFVRGDFRAPPASLRGRFDLVFSNEALHWTAPPPASLLAGRFFHRFLPLALRPRYERWAGRQWLAALKGVAALQAPGGTAVLQFGGRGQLQELFEAMARALPDKARGRLRYPTYYPSRADAARLLRRAGLKTRALRSWTEPLAEKSPREIVAFTRAFSEPGLRAVLSADDVELFYRRLLADLRRRMPPIRWRRILAVAEKCSR